jgi:hypothetical protein
MLRTGVIRRFDVTLPFATPKSSCGQARMLAVVGGSCTGRACRCKAKQGRRGKTALTCGTYSHTSTVSRRRREWKKIYLVTMATRRFFLIAQGSDCRWSPVTEILRNFLGDALMLWSGTCCRLGARFVFVIHECRNRDSLGLLPVHRTLEAGS